MEQKKNQNNITVARGGGNIPPQRVSGNGHQVDRSFAQPNPAVKQENPQPKANASEEEVKDSLTKNSTLGRDYTQEDSEQSSEENDSESNS